MPSQDDIDARILDYYETQFSEDARLTTRSAQGPLEFARVQELVSGHVAGGRVLDVGGGTGVHSRALQERGFDVALVDPVPSHVAVAQDAGIEASVGDARSLPFADGSFEAALLLGPLYHLASRDDRVVALREAARVTRPGGYVFAAAIPRFVAFAAAWLGDPGGPVTQAMVELLEHGTPAPGLRFPAGHFHTADELADEAAAAGLREPEVHGLEGPGGLFLEQCRPDETGLTEAALVLARAGSNMPGIRETSGHLMLVARVA